MKSLLYRIYLSPFEKELKELLDKETNAFSKMNFTYQSIILNLSQAKRLSFPANLGLLFLIENYISFFLIRKWIDELSKEGNHEKAFRLRTTNTRDTLGMLLANVKKYINNPDLISGLESINKDRNILTHKLLFASNEDKDIESVANNLINNIYTSFEKIEADIIPI